MYSNITYIVRQKQIQVIFYPRQNQVVSKRILRARRELTKIIIFLKLALHWQLHVT